MYPNHNVDCDYNQRNDKGQFHNSTPGAESREKFLTP